MSLFSRGSKRRASDEIREEDFQRFEDAPGTGGDFENPVSAVERGKLVRLERIQKKRRARRIRVAVVCTVLLAGILVYFTGLYGASLALLGDTVDSIRIALTPGSGFPVKASIPGYVESQPLAGGFVAVGEQDLVIYAANGNKVRTLQHGFANPCITAGNTRVCIYDRSGTQLRVENRSQTLYENQFDQSIFLCAMSPNGTLAVFLDGGLKVYDPMFNNIFEFKTEDLPTAMAFSDDNRNFAVACPKAGNGGLGSVIYLLNTGMEDYSQAVTVQVSDGIPLKVEYLDRQSVLVVYDRFAAIYNVSDGTEKARYDFGANQLQSAAVSGKNTVLLFGDGEHTELTRFVVLDTNLAAVGQAAVPVRANSVAASRSGVYVLTNTLVYCYGLDGSDNGSVDPGAKPLAVIDADRLLLLTQEQILDLDAPQTDASASAVSSEAVSQPASAS